MKVLILNWRDPKNPKSGGAEKVTLEHARSWIKYGWDVTWVSGGYTNSKSFEIIDDIKIYRYGNAYTVYLLAPFLFWLKFRNTDIIIDQIHGVPFLTPLWAPAYKKIAYIHEVAQDIWDMMFAFPLNAVGKAFEKFYFLFYKTIPFLTVSESTKKDLIAFGVPSENITVLPNGLSLEALKRPVKKNKQLTLLYVSRLVKMKGIEDAMGIFSLVNKSIPNSIFWIIGNGTPEYVNELKAKAETLGIEKQIRFLGYINEQSILRYYQKAHFLLHTSIREGFGLVVLEANSQGTPALVYNSPGLRDIVKNDVNGYIFAKGNNEEIAEKICLVFKNKGTLANLIRLSIDSCKHYKWEEITRQGIAYLKKVYGQK